MLCCCVSEPLRIEPPQRPYGRAAHERGCVIEQSRGLGGEPRVTRIADRDRHIAHETVAPGALDWRLRKQRAECSIVEAREFGERRAAQVVARSELRLAAGLRELVPWAHGEAIVAAIDAVTHR